MRAAPNTAVICAIVAGLGLADARLRPTAAQDGWNPFKSKAEQAPPRRSRENAAVAPPGAPASPGEATPDPAYVRPAPWQSPRGGPVERVELEPIMAPDTSGLPLELWRGLDLNTLEGLLAGLELPPRSPALHQLWRRLLLSNATPPAGAPDAEHFVALRLEALYRSGLLSDMEALLKDSGTAGPVVKTLAARRDIGLGQRDAGCQAINTLAAPRSGLPGRLKGETQLLAGYCAAAANDGAAASLAAELAREEGLQAELPLAVLAAVATGSKPRLKLPTRVLLLDYRFLELLGPVNAQQILEKAEPALLVVLAGDAKTDARARLAAAEAALRLNALAPEAVAEIYRRLASSTTGNTDPQSADPLLRRALFLRAAELAQAPAQRARFLRAMLDDARRTQAQAQTARLIAPLLANLQPASDVGWFAEAAVEIAAAAGDFSRARQWADAAGLRHWTALLDIGDPARQGGRLPSLAAMEELAVRGRLGAETLHRLATVLDALDIDVPIALWDGANRTPQPATGYLPETGVLADLAQSAKRNDAGRTILLVMRALGPDGPGGANVLALGDAIRALKRTGLEADARRLALEALLPAWPRVSVN